MNPQRCRLCGAPVPEPFASCRAVFEEVCAKEYSDRAFGAVHLLTVDAYALQHSEEHGPRSNAFHLLRLCRLLEEDSDAGLGQRPPRDVGKAFEKQYRALPNLEPPQHRGDLTVAHVHGASNAEEHAERVLAWARSVWEAYGLYHQWAWANCNGAA